MSESRRPRLDTPRDTRRQLVRRPAVDADAFGVFAESFARYMGTAKFLLWMTMFVIAWVAVERAGARPTCASTSSRSSS